MIEPAAMGVAVCFGPNTVNFREVSQALVAEQAAVVVNSQAAMLQFVQRCLIDPEYYNYCTRRRNLSAQSSGSTSALGETNSPGIVSSPKWNGSLIAHPHSQRRCSQIPAFAWRSSADY